MELSADKQREYIRRILIARMSILTRNGFFGLLLMHMKFALDDTIGTAATDGERIFFDPKFLDEISDSELIFVLMHEIMHVVLNHSFRTDGRDEYGFNIACDIVVNSNILQSAGGNLKSITLSKYGESMHIAPDGREGYNYTAEEVYEMLPAGVKAGGPGNGYGSGFGMKNGTGSGSSTGNTAGSAVGNATGNAVGNGVGNAAGNGGGLCDNHSKWGNVKDEALEALWSNRIRDAYEASRTNKSRGSIPMGAERAVKELMDPKVDWRTLLNDFIQEEVVDYSFMPPDRRFSDSPFLLPDFNDTETIVRDILFMIDTSGSMSDEEITQAYSEIKGAIDQFGGRLEGWLGFFDAEVVPPKPFADEDEFKVIRPEGGGGTSFDVIFDYVRSEMDDREIASIIIMTDGWAPFPEESAAMGIPVLWMINNDDITPPWGKAARL